MSLYRLSGSAPFMRAVERSNALVVVVIVVVVGIVVVVVVVVVVVRSTPSKR
jgi:hypothetical protein